MSYRVLADLELKFDKFVIKFALTNNLTSQLQIDDKIVGSVIKLFTVYNVLLNNAE